MMKTRSMLFCIMLFACLFGCKSNKIIDTVVWRNSTSYDLQVSVYVGETIWKFALPQGCSQQIYQGVRPDACMYCYIPTDLPPIEYWWACQRGAIDSVSIYHADTLVYSQRAVDAGTLLSNIYCYKETIDVPSNYTYTFT